METMCFPLTVETKKEISCKFGIREDFIDKMMEDYDRLIQNIPYQYLAHIMRTMETYIRENIPDSEFFRITCNPTKTSNDKIKMQAMANYVKPDSFDIVYDKDMNDLQKRVCIAHELGHLFLVIMKDRAYDDKHEPLSTVYGILTMLHKQACKNKENHKSDKDVVLDFSLMFNRNNGEFNIS